MTTEYILMEEMEHVLAALTPQNRLIMRTILHTGMRLSDVLNLRTEQLKPSGWYTEGKTGKRRRYGFPADLLEEIQAQAGPEWAFPGFGAGGGHKTRQAVWKDVKRASRAFRLPQNIGPHSGRKIYAVDLMKKYGDIEKVRRALNHDCSTVTAIYAMADVLTERRQAARRRRSDAARAKREADRRGGTAASGGGDAPRPPRAAEAAPEPASRKNQARPRGGDPAGREADGREKKTSRSGGGRTSPDAHRKGRRSGAEADGSAREPGAPGGPRRR